NFTAFRRPRPWALGRSCGKVKVERDRRARTISQELLPMTTATLSRPDTLSREQLEQYHHDGYLVVRGMFTPEEVRELRDTFMQIHAGAPIGNFYQHASEEEAAGDPLKLYPRVMHPHGFDELSMQRMLDPRIAAVLWDLFGEEPLAAQSMF